jgi:hypothetical protein
MKRDTNRFRFRARSATSSDAGCRGCPTHRDAWSKRRRLRAARLTYFWSGRCPRLEDGELLDALNDLLRRQVLDMPLPGRMQFLHDKIREVAYEQTAGDRLAQLHRAAAQTLDKTPDAEKAELLAALGGHWERAGVPDEALRCYLIGRRGEPHRGTPTRRHSACTAPRCA